MLFFCVSIWLYDSIKTLMFIDVHFQFHPFLFTSYWDTGLSLCVFGWDAFSGLIQILMGLHLVDVQSLHRNGRHLYDQQQPLVITGGYK